MMVNDHASIFPRDDDHRRCQSRRDAVLGVVCFLFNHAHRRERAMAMALICETHEEIRSHLPIRLTVAQNRLGIRSANRIKRSTFSG